MRFTICVSLCRQGLILIAAHFNQLSRVTIPIMYLPRSTPPSEVQSHPIYDPLTGYRNQEERFTTVDLHSGHLARAALEKLQTSAQVPVATPYLYQVNLS